MTSTSATVGLTTPKIKVTLSGTQETLFITLFGRHLDTLRKDPILNDTMSTAVLDKLDYDFTKLGVGQATACSIAARSELFDRWTRAYLSKHKYVTVVHVGCGLDTRFDRIKWTGDNVRWIDVDLPDVIELRKQIFPKHPDPMYCLVAASATDLDFIRRLPRDRTALIILEGLSLYLDPEEGKAMVREYIEHFHSGQIIMDSVNWLSVALQRKLTFMRGVSSPLRWAIDDPQELAALSYRARLVKAVPLCRLRAVSRFPLAARILLWISSWFPATRDTVRYLQYTFAR